MSFKAAFLFVTLLVGSIAFPLEDVEQDMSIFFENVDPSARIIGGTPAGLVPYMVSLTIGAIFRSLICGGSLVSTRHILTAAHCIIPLPSNLRGNVGSERFNFGGDTYSFSSGIVHPEYNGNIIKNDIGILVTSSEVKLKWNVALISLNWDFIGDGVATRATGWGVSSDGVASQILLRLDAIVLDGAECARRIAERGEQVNLPPPPLDPSIEICTFDTATTGMCRGDSGSPLVLRGTNQQIGIVSWGLPCARNAPDMFVRNSAFRSWVEEIIG